MRGMVVSKCLCGRATLRGGMQRQTHAAKLLCQNVATGLDLLSKTRWRRPSIHQATTFSRVQARRPLTDSSKNQTVGEIGRRTKTVPLLCRLVCSKSCWTKSTVLHHLACLSKFHWTICKRKLKGFLYDVYEASFGPNSVTSKSNSAKRSIMSLVD